MVQREYIIVDINLNCLDAQPSTINITEFDGKNWEDHAHKPEYKSKET